MMGHRGKMRGALEYDALTQWKQYLGWAPGMRKAIKRNYNKRMRKLAKRDIESWLVYANERGE